MPCWPDIWEHVRRFLPLLGGLGLGVAYIGLIAILLWAPKVRSRWLRNVSRALGVLGIIPAIIALPAILLGLALAAGNPPAQTRTVQSQDGQQAVLSYEAGFLGRDYTEVRLKRLGSCRHTTVFWHAGPSWFDDMKVEWVDNRHLRLTYHARSGDPQHCEPQTGEVTVVCTASDWPNATQR